MLVKVLGKGIDRKTRDASWRRWRQPVEDAGADGPAYVLLKFVQRLAKHPDLLGKRQHRLGQFAHLRAATTGVFPLLGVVAWHRNITQRLLAAAGAVAAGHLEGELPPELGLLGFVV